MSHSHEDEHFSDELQHVADMLRGERPTLDPLALDRVKLRAMSAAHRSSSSQPKGFVRQRLTTLITVGFLVLGTGGTLALAGGVGGSGADSASFNQYKPPCVHGKGLGVPNECPGEKIEPPPCVHGKGRGVPNECPGEKAKKVGKGGAGGKSGKGKGGHGGKAGKAGKGGGHGGKNGGGHSGNGKSGGKGKGGHGGKSNGAKGRHGGKGGHGRKSSHGGKAGHAHH